MRSETVGKLFEQFLNEQRAKDKKLMDEIGITYQDPFEDVRWHTDKAFEYTTNHDESKGWTGTMTSLRPKTKADNILLAVTYDGAGYDYFTYDSPMNYADKFIQYAKKKGYNIHIEHATNWAFAVYEED
jgi:hypothetical protein